jgi:hypothetical protein
MVEATTFTKSYNGSESQSSSAEGAGALDWLGVGASLTCALHCAVIPIVVLALPALGASWLFSERVARWMIGTSALIALLSLTGGFRLHAHAGPFILAGVGVALLVAGEVAEGGLIRGAVLGLAGGLLIAGAHLLNRSLCLACPPCSIGDAASDGACRSEEPQ